MENTKPLRKIVTQGYVSVTCAVGTVVGEINDFAKTNVVDWTYNRLIVILYASLCALCAVLSMTQSWWKISSILNVYPADSNQSGQYVLDVEFGIQGEYYTSNYPTNFSTVLVTEIVDGADTSTYSSGHLSWSQIPNATALYSVFNDLLWITSSQIGAAGLMVILVCFTTTQWIRYMRMKPTSILMLILPTGLLGLSTTAAVYLTSIASDANDYVCAQFVYQYGGSTSSFQKFCEDSHTWTGNAAWVNTTSVHYEFLISSNPALGWWVQSIVIIMSFALVLMIAFGSDDLLGYENQYPLTSIDEERSKAIARDVLKFLETERMNGSSNELPRGRWSFTQPIHLEDSKSCEG